MSKMRVYEFAKTVGKSNSEIIDILTKLGVSIKSHMSSIDSEEIELVKKELASEKKVKEVATVKLTKEYEKISLQKGASVSDVATAIGEKPGNAVKLLMAAGLMIPATAVADEKILEVLEEGFKKQFVFLSEKEIVELKKKEIAAEVKLEKKVSVKIPEKEIKESKKPVSKKVEKLLPRPPIVTVMGHVDHGKTSLLDYIRNTKITDKEAGGITQHIGAASVSYKGNAIVFLDTPGHEAFTLMRARGAQVTDIAILVVAADDGIMPQTIEAINHAKAANVPIVVAVNKIDKPDALPERVRQQLSDYGLVPEEWGGDTIMVDVAAKTGENIDKLLEMVLLVAEMQELTADYTAKPTGTVIEANLDKGKGPVATVIVQQGTLRKGDIINTKTAWGKIRAMLDDSGNIIEEATPSTPVEILGLENVPMPGDIFATLSSEREARDIMSQNEFERREIDQSKTKRLTLEELYEKMQTKEVPQLNLVLKADVQGSIEAFHSSLMKMNTEDVVINIVHQGVGRISESDVMLASASNAVIIGFNVRPDSNAKKIAENDGVQIRYYQVIYDMLDDVKAAMEGMLEPELRESTLGSAEIRDIFRVPKIGNIAGCRITEGLIRRNAKVRLIRDGVVFWNGELSSLKHFKDDVREIKSGNECGLSFEKFQDFRIGDVIEAYEILKKKRTLD